MLFFILFFIISLFPFSLSWQDRDGCVIKNTMRKKLVWEFNDELHCHVNSIKNQSLFEFLSGTNFSKSQTYGPDLITNSLILDSANKYQFKLFYIGFEEGNVTIDSRLFSKPSMKSIEEFQFYSLGTPEQTRILNISPDAFSTTSNMKKILMADGFRDNQKLILTHDTLRAFESLKNQTEEFRIFSTESRHEITSLLEKCMKLKVIETKGVPLSTNLFKKSASTLVEIKMKAEEPLPVITKDMFKGMVNLQRLDLNVPISEIEPNAFDDLKELTHITLTDNKFNSLPHGIFNKTEKLKHVAIGYSIRNLGCGNFTYAYPRLRLMIASGNALCVNYG